MNRNHIRIFKMPVKRVIGLLAYIGGALGPQQLSAQSEYINRTQMSAVSGITAQARADINSLTFTNPSATQLNDLKVLIAPGVVYDAQKYILATRLNQRAELKPIFTDKFQRQNLQSKANYQEVVEVKNNELSVIRTLTLETKDPCSAALKKVINVCFEKRGKTLSQSVKNDLKNIRAKIRRGNGGASGKPNSQTKLLAMTDSQLLDYILNRQTTSKKITHRSSLPLVAYRYSYDLSNSKVNKLKQPIASVSELRSEVNRIKSSTVTLPKGLTPPAKNHPKRTGQNPRRVPAGDPLTFNHKVAFSEQFLAGFTFGREFGDTYRVQFSEETWFTDEYYASFTYHLSAGFGLRFPLEVRGSSKVTDVYAGKANFSYPYPARELCSAAKGNKAAAFQCAKTAEVALTVIPFDADPDDYLEMGVDATQVFGGKELVFEIGATCRLFASIPGEDVSRTCPAKLKGIDFGRNFVPQIGSIPRPLFKRTIPGRPLGIALETGIGYAALNPGIALQAINGRLTFDVLPNRSDIVAKEVNLTNKVTRFDVSEKIGKGGKSDFGFDLVGPRYQVNTRLVPLIEIEIGIDLGIMGWDHTYGPYEIDDLAIELAEFEFTAHEGSPTKLHVPKVGYRSNPY